MANFFIIYISTVTASLSYCYFISSKLPKGMYRFISLIPVFYLFTTLPLRSSAVFTAAITFSFTTWLTNFKLIRFAFDLDQSPLHPSDSLIQFIVNASLPIKRRTTNSTSAERTRFRFRLGFQILIFSILVRVVLNYKNRLHTKVVSYIYGWFLFLLIDIVAAMVNSLVLILTGLELEPSSNEPYFATSLQSFWGRWNLLVNNALRQTIYKPVLSAFSNYKWAPFVGVLSSFLVSGLMHELYIYLLSRMAPTWEMTSFFVLHGICVILEMVIKRALARRGWRPLPDFVAILLMNAFVIATGVWLFIPPFVRGRVDVKMLQDYKAVSDFIKTRFFTIQRV